MNEIYSMMPEWAQRETRVWLARWGDIGLLMRIVEAFGKPIPQDLKDKITADAVSEWKLIHALACVL